jgi:hypothetical protein
MKKKYKVQGDTKNTFMNIELDLVLETEELGTSVNVLGGTFKITQNGKILVLSDPEWVLTLMDVTPPAVVEKPKLEINKTIDIFFGDEKKIDVQVDCTYEEVFYFLQNEWKQAGALSATILPCDYTERLKLFTFFDHWNFTPSSLKFLKEGSFVRRVDYNLEGRCSTT